MIDNRLVTVIVCTHNSEKTIERTIKSVIEQKYKPIQILIADDASEDGTAYIAENLIKSNKLKFHTSSKLIRNAVRVGTVQNIRSALTQAEGRWIKPIAGDDLLLDNCLIELVYNLDKYDADIGISDTKIIDENDMVKNGHQFLFHLVPLFLKMPKWWRLQYLSSRNIFPAPTIIVDRKVASQLYDQIDQKIIEDWPFWMLALEQNFRILHINKSLIAYRQHSIQVTQKHNGVIYEEIKRDLDIFSIKYGKYRASWMRLADKIIYFLAINFNKNTKENGLFHHVTIKLFYSLTKILKVSKSGEVTKSY